MSAARAPESPGEEFGGLRYPPGRRPSTQRRRLPPRTCCLAVALTTLGTCLFVAGCVASFGANGGSAAVELFVLAALTLLPGVYASYHLVGIKLRWPGFDNVAMFHEDVPVRLVHLNPPACVCPFQSGCEWRPLLPLSRVVDGETRDYMQATLFNSPSASDAT